MSRVRVVLVEDNEVDYRLPGPDSAQTTKELRADLPELGVVA
ncbi:MAG TPA: hypothetical protein VMU72_07990 [Gaiellaceae bacterium]|nr:hypothetical protein [Gaiellaceae bacterium]